MGQQNEPRWGLFKQGGSAGPAFLKLLEELETDGIIERQFGEQVPENLNGVSGWIVKEGMMEAWQRRRQVPLSTLRPSPADCCRSLAMSPLCSHAACCSPSDRVVA
jgi:hypothetical protein